MFSYISAERAKRGVIWCSAVPEPIPRGRSLCWLLELLDPILGSLPPLPANQREPEIMVELFHQHALAAYRVEHPQQERAQKPFRRNGWPPVLGLDGAAAQPREKLT